MGRAFGTRPSALLEMDDAGYGPAVCLALDDGYLAFVQQFERMRDATTWLPDTEHKKKARPLKEVHVYSREEILAFLDIDNLDEMRSPVVDNALDILDDGLWESIPGWDAEVSNG